MQGIFNGIPRPAGIEPAFPAPEADALSIGLRTLKIPQNSTTAKFFNQCKIPVCCNLNKFQVTGSGKHIKYSQKKNVLYSYKSVKITLLLYLLPEMF